jgi:nitrite reductase (NADH) large subunit
MGLIMKLIIIGNGVAGQLVAEGVRKKDKNAEILMICKEPYPYYTRVFLPHYIAEERTKEELYLRDFDWYNENNIQMLMDTTATKIDPKNHLVYVENETKELKYDKLVIATGSSSRKLPFGNPNVEGMFTLRTIDDADAIINFITERNVKQAFIIGGGLLGIEAGFHIHQLDVEVTICEVFPYLLPRQLDKDSANLLQKYLESQGLKFILGQSVKQIIGNPAVEMVELESGLKIKSQMVLQQMGVIPNLELAKISGLKTDKGVVVNEFMRTDDSDIYAAGDCIQFNNQLWGIIPACMDQAKIVVAQILQENKTPYVPTVWTTKLKVAGIDLTCVGAPNPQNEKEATTVSKTDQNMYLCRKVILEKDKLTGAILMGPGGDSKFFINNVGKNVKIDEVKKKVME